MAAAGAVTLLAGLWKGWFGARRDVRRDSEERTYHGGYEQVIAELRQALRDLKAELEVERRLRRESDLRCDELERKLRLAEAKCEEMANLRPK